LEACYHYQTSTTYFSFASLNLSICFDVNTFHAKILLGIQELLDSPNANSPAQKDAYQLYVYVSSLMTILMDGLTLSHILIDLLFVSRTDRMQYYERVRQQAAQYPPPS
jgi:ubiquitin-protein ligase